MKKIDLVKGRRIEDFVNEFNDAGFNVTCYHDTLNIYFVERPVRKNIITRIFRTFFPKEIC